MIESSDRWTPSDSAELYDIERWGQGYFSISDNGHVCVHPDRSADKSIDLPSLVDRIRLRGLDAPVLLRFNGIIRDRLKSLHNAFQTAISDHDYQGTYRCVYPIKVNQQRQVVEKVVEYGSEFGFGLEAGSKPELLAVVAMANAETPIVCNGFKDSEFVEMALLAQQLGRHVIPVVEKFTELEMILDCAQRLNVRPTIGMRVKLAARGAGRWQSSGGYRSKFGLRVNELLKAVQLLESRGMSDCFQLLHFHLGSQITNIRQVKTALTEAARIYTELASHKTGLRYLDVGGGLGVDYDGSQTNFESSMNYSLEEYARDVVYHIKSTCDEAGIQHPDIISESGRAVSAYHSVLIFNVLGAATQGPRQAASTQVNLTEHAVQPLRELGETLDRLTPRNLREAYHDAQLAIDQAMHVFTSGHLSLEDRCLAEETYFAICQRIWMMAQALEEVPEELRQLDRLLSDNYFCNFSLFQSIPDSWAIGQLFPVVPIHRHTIRPIRQAVLSDITCDSDGKIDQFINRRDVKRTLQLHDLDGQPYYLAAFLVGAYQEILGDLHNLFGDTNAVHVDLTETGEVILQHLMSGETVTEVLEYVQYDRRSLLDRLQAIAEAEANAGRITDSEAGRFIRFYDQALNGYTYLEDAND